jgi:hypothetical protein
MLMVWISAADLLLLLFSKFRSASKDMGTKMMSETVENTMDSSYDAEKENIR